MPSEIPNLFEYFGEVQPNLSKVSANRVKNQHFVGNNGREMA